MNGALRLTPCVVVGLGLLVAPGPSGRAGDAPFGFRSLEIFKVSDSSTGLAVADLDGDGRKDLVVADNAEAAILLLYQRPPGAPVVEDDGRLVGAELSKKSSQLNKIRSDTRFRQEKFYTESHVNSLAVGDFNGDDRPDLAYYTDPPQLHVVLNAEAWGSSRDKFSILDGAGSGFALDAVDLDADQRTDLILLGKGKVYILYQGDSGLRQPVELSTVLKNPWDAEVVDLNGDDRLDLLVLEPGGEESLAVRLQGEHGFGAERIARLGQLHSWLVAPFPVRGGAAAVPTVFAIKESTGRLKAYRWRKKPTKTSLSTPTLLALRSGGQASERRRSLVDVNHDGRVDVVVSYPDTAQLEVRFQDEAGGLSRTVLFPTLAGVNGLAAVDVDGDGSMEIVVTSAREKAIGISRWRDGRLHIPELLPLAEEPVLLDASTTPTKGGKTFVLSKAKEGYTLDIHALGAAPGESRGLLREGILEPVARQALEGKGGIPSAMRLLDANGDGATDVLVFVPYEDPYLYVQREAPAEKATGTAEEAKVFREVSRAPGFGLGQLSKLDATAIHIVDFTNGRSQLVVAAGRYVRILELDDEERLRVAAQVSSRSAGAKLVAAALLNLDSDPEKEIVILDAATNQLDIYQVDTQGTYEFSASVEVPKLDLLRVLVEDLNVDGRSDLVLVGGSQLSVLYARDHEDGLEEALTYTLDDKKDLGELHDLTSGDLNADGFADLVLATNPYYNLLLLTPSGGEEADEADGAVAGARAESAGQDDLQLRMVFPIFEEKTFMRRRPNYGPREMLTADIDGDDLEDLLLLIHDRVLLYLQDSGA